MLIWIYALFLLLSLIFTRQLPKGSFSWNLSLLSSAFTGPLFLLTGAIFLEALFAGKGIVASLLAFEILFLAFLLFSDALAFSPSWQDWMRIFAISNYFDFQPHYLDVEDCDGGKRQAKIYFAKEMRAPIIFQISGGGFSYGGLDQLNPYNRFLCRLGYHVVVLPYRKIPGVELSIIVQDLRSAALSAIAALEKKGALIKEVLLSGRSAGGYLCFALAESLPKGLVSKVIAFYPLVDFQMIAKNAHDGDLLNWPERLKMLFPQEETRSQRLAEASVSSFKNLQGLRILAFHGDRDPVVDVEQSKKLSQIFPDRKACRVFFLKRQSHGFEANLNSFASRFCLREIERFLNEK
jgi:acetyl esterase/lipase